jgi:hypothetical protein
VEKSCIFALSITIKPKDMTTQITIQSEIKRRTDLIENEDFRKLCIKAAKELGITAKEWNENKAMLLFFFANQMCGIENKMN